MAKQTKQLPRQCGRSSHCRYPAAIGIYRWELGESDVNLDRPVLVCCSRHKPTLRPHQNLRNVRIAR